MAVTMVSWVLKNVFLGMGWTNLSLARRKSKASIAGRLQIKTATTSDFADPTPNCHVPTYTAQCNIYIPETDSDSSVPPDSLEKAVQRGKTSKTSATLRDVSRKKTGKCGKFSQAWEPHVCEGKMWFILHFRTLGIFLVWQKCSLFGWYYGL